jgi:hypothetical protein
VFPEDEECEDRNGDLERFCGTKKYISSLNTKVDSYEKEKVRLLLCFDWLTLILMMISQNLVFVVTLTE